MREPCSKSRCWFVSLISLSLVVLLAGGFLAWGPGGPPRGNVLLAQAADKASKQSKGKKQGKGKKGAPKNPFPNLPLAPSLDGGTAWLNTGGEISLKDLRGKVVLLDFWTYCCINCMHVLPDLEYLEKKYDKELVVIGVHSAKFDNEKKSESIRRAILRYEIEHPVINDANMTVWRKFQVRSWPTLVLIDPEGRYVGQQPGEGNRELFDKVIGMLVEYHGRKGTLDTTPVRFDLERNRLKASPLKFPGKVLADVKGQRLFISDSNHNRLVITKLDGTLIETIGTGVSGRTNGGYDSASFDHPQGVALLGEKLYVADTENHLIRVVDLKRKLVRTLAGTGKQDRLRTSGGSLKKTALNSPWAVSHVNGTLYIAMAGPHQLWSHKLGSSRIQSYAGSGREDITDGPLASAALAQPSALATDGQHLFVADSEGSAIRQVDTPRGKVSTVVGPSGLRAGRALFEFGDTDGVGGTARLQHPLGVAFDTGTLYVADSYNHKIKRVDLKTRKATSWLGTGQRGDGISPPSFAEPAGVSVGVGKLYIADTNNHRICVADLKTGKVSVLQIKGLTPPRPPEQANQALGGSGKPIPVSLQAIGTAKPLSVQVPLSIPKGFKLNTKASVLYHATAAKGQVVLAPDALGKRRRAKVSGTTATVSLDLTGKPGKTTLELAVSYQVCRDGTGGLCKLHVDRWSIPLSASLTATASQIVLKAAAR